MPRESIRSVVLSAEKDAVKRFLSHVHQSWDQIQVETMQVKPFSAMKVISDCRYQLIVHKPFYG